jgi:hypothetical protein
VVNVVLKTGSNRLHPVDHRRPRCCRKILRKGGQMPEQTSRIVKVEVQGKTIAMEVTPLGGEERVADLPHDFEELTASIEGIASSLYGAIKKIAPKKACIEFGVEAGVESGKLTALLVKGSGKANLKITLEWS